MRSDNIREQGVLPRLLSGAGGAGLSFDIHRGEALKVLRTLPAESVQCCVTSPPYWGLRDYGTGQWEGGLPDCDHKQRHGSGESGQRADRTYTGQVPYRESCGKCGAVRVDEQIGLELTYQLYLARITEVFREVRRVLRKDGTLWVNIGDSYCSDAGRDRVPTTLPGSRVPSGWTNRAQPYRAHATRKKTDKDPKRLASAAGAIVSGVTGMKPKDLMMMPARVALALQEDGWWLRSDIIWHKPAPMPESVRDRPTKAHEYVFLFAKGERYFYDYVAIMEPTTGGAHVRGKGLNPKARTLNANVNNGHRPRQNESFSAAVTELVSMRNSRSVWTLGSMPTSDAHFATFPIELPERCILAGTRPGDTVLDPFAGAGTTGMAALKNDRKFIGIELNPEYIKIADKRLADKYSLFA